MAVLLRVFTCTRAQLAKTLLSLKQPALFLKKTGVFEGFIAYSAPSQERSACLACAHACAPAYLAPTKRVTQQQTQAKEQKTPKSLGFQGFT